MQKNKRRTKRQSKWRRRPARKWAARGCGGDRFNARPPQNGRGEKRKAHKAKQVQKPKTPQRQERQTRKQARQRGQKDTKRERRKGDKATRQQGNQAVKRPPVCCRCCWSSVCMVLADDTERPSVSFLRHLAGHAQRRLAICFGPMFSTLIRGNRLLFLPNVPCVNATFTVA